MNEEALKHVFNHEARWIGDWDQMGDRYAITGAGGELLDSLCVVELFKMFKKTYNKKGNHYDRP